MKQVSCRTLKGPGTSPADLPCLSSFKFHPGRGIKPRLTATPHDVQPNSRYLGWVRLRPRPMLKITVLGV